MNIQQVMEDKNLLGKVFASDTWDSWKALLLAFYGLPLDEGRGRSSIGR